MEWLSDFIGWILDLIADGWDALMDSLIASWEFILSMFDFSQGFSIAGLIFGIGDLILIYSLRNWTLKPFTDFMPPFQRVFWTMMTYGFALIGGYLVGQGLFSSE